MEGLFLTALGPEKVRERIFIPAESHQTELEEATRAVDELSALAGTMTSTTMRSRLTEQLRALDCRIAALETLPTREAGWTSRETDQTYAEAWETLDTEQRRQLLLRAGITISLRLEGRKGLIGELHTPDDVIDRVTQKSPPAGP